MVCPHCRMWTTTKVLIDFSCKTRCRPTSSRGNGTGHGVHLGHVQERRIGTRSVIQVHAHEQYFHDYVDPQRIDHDIHENGIFDLQWSPDDGSLATCSGDHTARITDVTTGKTLHILRGHTSTVKTVTWDPQHVSLLSTGGRDGGIRVWDLRIAGSMTQGLTSHSPVTVIDGAHGEDKRK
jgi:WD40 repeat protein